MEPRKHLALSEDHLATLIAIAGAEYVSVAEADREQHARDQSFHPSHRPAVVVWPADTKQISAILSFANRARIPVTPWGAGTSLEGNPVPVKGGITLDTSRLSRILAVYPDDYQIKVEVGVLYKDMNAQIARHGLFFAPDPGANASIGGMIANNAAGTRTLKYGATKDNVLRLEVVLASGEVIQTGSLASKSASGYNLLHLFVGSEGTLGVITSATLRLAPLPEKFSAAVATFPAVAAATRAVSAIMGSGVTPAALEFLDAATASQLDKATEFSLPPQPVLLMEFHSATGAGLSEELRLIQEICRLEGCTSFEAGLGRAERDRLWQVRHRTYEILVCNNPGRSFLVADVAVPVSRFPQLVDVCRRAMDESGLDGYLVGHAGDGNLHPLVPYQPDDEASLARANAAHARMVEAAIELGGTVTGEHGVGFGKRKYLPLEHGASLAVMRRIKTALDPHGILNPGKIF
jgi:D-lactate dehydrogenase (cytochrome)